MASSRARKVVAFYPFKLDLASGELVRNGHRIRLQDQSFQILVALLEHPGELVSREELRNRLWSADTFVDYEHGLNNAVKRLRRALGDTAEKARYVETLPKRGYRFIAAVRSIADSDAGEGPEVVSAAPQEKVAGTSRPASASSLLQREFAAQEVDKPAVIPASIPDTPQSASSAQAHNVVKHTSSRQRLWAAAALALVCGLAGLSWWSSLHRPRPLRSLAVLPFTNLSGDPSQGYFADAMTEEMTTDLGKITALHVISRTSAMQYKNTAKTVPEIARELHVQGVIEGSVVRYGGRVRVTAQLIDANSDRHLWSESYERDAKDVLALQGELARMIAAQVRLALTPAEEDVLHAAPVNPVAYEAYLRGRFYMDRWNAEDSAQALSSFQRAVELDNSYALAWVGIAECYVYGVAGVNEKERWQRGFAAVNQALRLQPSMGEAHAMLGMLLLERDWDFTSAEAEIRRGIALSPNYAAVHHWYSHLLLEQGRMDEAFAEATKLMALDPVSSTPVGHLAFYYLATRQWDASIAQFQKLFTMDPSLIGEHAQLGEAYLEKHMFPEALAEIDRSVELSRSRAEHPYYLAQMGFALAQAGDTPGARRVLLELPAEHPEYSAYIQAGLGNKEKSLELLEEAYHRHTFPLDAGFAVEFDALRADLRFQDLLHRTGLR